jgi:hypothetical protein
VEHALAAHLATPDRLLERVLGTLQARHRHSPQPIAASAGAERRAPAGAVWCEALTLAVNIGIVVVGEGQEAGEVGLRSPRR